MKEQISPNATRTIHTYPGPTRDPIQQHRDRALAEYKGLTREQCRAALESMGALNPDRARARVWARFSTRERREFLRIAGHDRVANAESHWQDMSEPTRSALWNTIKSAAAWGDRVREAMQ